MAAPTIFEWRRLDQHQKDRNDVLLKREGAENYLNVIKSRITEVQDMTNPPPRPPLIYELVDDDTKERITKFDEIDRDEFVLQRRSYWKGKSDKWRFAAKMVIIICRCCKKWQQTMVINPDKAVTQNRRGASSKGTKTVEDEMARCSVGWEVQSYLCIAPHLRTRKQLKKIDWILRATKAFKQLFPEEMQKAAAKFVGYNRFQDSRLICKQDRRPEWFYYVLSGKIMKFRQYKLSSGVVNRSMGSITKGMSTDVDELVTGTLRECTLLAKGQVEVLVLHRSAFLHLQHTSDDLPLDFISKLEIFRDFPVNRILSQKDEAVQYTYYGTGQVITKDTNRTPWLHIIKTGNVKVVRKQMVVDTKNEYKFNKQEMDELGYAKPPSHAAAMLGQAYQQKIFKEDMKNEQEIGRFPPKELMEGSEDKLTKNCEIKPNLARVMLVSPNKQHRTVVHKEVLGNIPEETNDTIKIQNLVKDDTFEDEVGESDQDITQSQSNPRSIMKSSSSSTQRLSPDIENDHENSAKVRRKEVSLNGGLNPFSTATPSPNRRKLKRKETKGIEAFLPPVINIPIRDSKDDDEDDLHPFFITREKTNVSLKKLGTRKRADKLFRPTYVLLDVLHAGEMFGLEDIYKYMEKQQKESSLDLGLEHLVKPSASEPKGYSLISDGAEVIRISKRFFLENANNNTMLKVDTLLKAYMGEPEAQESIHDRETWTKYKSALMQKMISTIVKRNSPKHHQQRKMYKELQRQNTVLF